MRAIELFVATTVLAAGVSPIAGAQDGRRVMLGTDAFQTPSGPIVKFTEFSSEREMNAPVIRRMQVARPDSVAVRTPPAKTSLGRLEFFVGPRTCPTCDDRRVLTLRRGRSLGHGAYVLAHGHGARVVLSTRSRSRFLDVSLPGGSRNVVLVLKRAGARLLQFSCSQGGPAFTGRFTQASDIDRDTSTLSRRRIQRAGLC